MMFELKLSFIFVCTYVYICVYSFFVRTHTYIYRYVGGDTSRYCQTKPFRTPPSQPIPQPIPFPCDFGWRERHCTLEWFVRHCFLQAGEQQCRIIRTLDNSKQVLDLCCERKRILHCTLAVPVGLDPPGESPASPCWGHPVGNDLNPCDGVRHLKVYTAPGRMLLPNGWRQMEPIPP